MDTQTRNSILKAGAGALAIAVALVSRFEGKKNHGYLDVGGIPTICYGHTEGVHSIDYKTDDECKAILRNELQHYLEVVQDNVTVDIPDTTKAALASFAYNVGEGAFKGSTLLKKLNAGDRIGACNELLRWSYVNGHQWRGLLERRKVEQWFCLQGD